MEGEENLQETDKNKERKTTAVLHSHLITSHPREFWKVLAKTTAASHICIPIDIIDMAEYVRQLNSRCTEQVLISNTLFATYHDDFLDDDTLEEEVLYAIK